jgi:hypothetical protein
MTGFISGKLFRLFTIYSLRLTVTRSQKEYATEERVAIHYLPFTIYQFYLLRPLESARSIEAMPPPAIINANDIANSASAYSYPPLLTRKPAGQ